MNAVRRRLLAQLRADVELLRVERMRPVHRIGSEAHFRQEGEGNAFDMVLRLIDGKEPDGSEPGRVFTPFSPVEGRRS